MENKVYNEHDISLLRQYAKEVPFNAYDLKVYNEHDISLLRQYTKELDPINACDLLLLPSLSIKNSYFINDPIEDMPLYISSEFKAYRQVARWRLAIGK